MRNQAHSCTILPGHFDTEAADRARLAVAAALGDGLAQLLRMTRALVMAERCVDLVGLESGIGQLCARALDLPSEHGKPLALRLRMLRAEIDLLEATTRGRRALS